MSILTLYRWPLVTRAYRICEKTPVINHRCPADWDSLDAHNAFIDSDPYGPFLERLRPLLDGAPQLFHIKLPTSPSPSPFDAPVTECISLYFEPSIEESTYDKSFANFVAAAEKVQGSGAKGLVGGWGVEEHRFEGDGDKMKVFGGFIGWPSVESHMEFRGMEEFPAVVAYLREGVDKVKVHHVAFKRFEA